MISPVMSTEERLRAATRAAADTVAARQRAAAAAPRRTRLRRLVAGLAGCAAGWLAAR